MIKGVGIDIIEIERIERAIQKNHRFLEKVFHCNEIMFFQENKVTTNTIAGTFAAKEAVVKALGTGLRNFGWHDIEIKRDSLGKPVAMLHGNAHQIMMEKDIADIMITISHCKLYAVAQAIAI
ncbi:MAG: holo-ACP synthase [Bacillota bacterium]